MIERPGGPVVNVTGVDLVSSGFVNLGSLTLVYPDGSRKRANLNRGVASLLTPSINRIRWVPLRQGGKWNREVRRVLKGKAGVYAIREAGSRTTLYVGEGGKRRGAPHLRSKDPDRMMRTILRHFQAGFTPEDYATGYKIGGKRQRRRDGGKQSAAIAYSGAGPEGGRFEEYRAGGKEWTWHKRGDLEIALYITPPREARAAEGRWILELEPTGNVEFIDATGDASFPFGS